MTTVKTTNKVGRGPNLTTETSIANALPNRNHDFSKTRMPQKGTCTFLCRFMRQSPKRQTMFSGNKKPRFGHIRMCKSRRRQSPKRQTMFSGNKKPRFGDQGSAQLVPLGTDPQQMGFKGAHAPLPYMLSRKWLQKSSANYLVTLGFAQKGFAISIFGHFFCPFPENFIESCRVKTKNNNFNLCSICMNSESIMVT
jgi:hypothetical protein